MRRSIDGMIYLRNETRQNVLAKPIIDPRQIGPNIIISLPLYTCRGPRALTRLMLGLSFKHVP